MPVDLHIHSTYSDGSLTPTEVVAEAARIGLSAVAIADHDCVDGVPEALKAGRALGVRVIPAVEISAESGDAEIHILGYYVNYRDPALNALLASVRDGRQTRARQIVDRLNGLGVRLSFEEVVAAAGEGSIGRPHIASLLADRGYVSSAREAFERYLKYGRPAHVPRVKLVPHDVVERVVAASGLPVLAHPGLAGRDGMIPELMRHGLGGIEAYHTDHSPAQTDYYIALAARHGLLVTGGTDSHGPRGPAPVAIGSTVVPDDCADCLEAWGRARGRLHDTAHDVPEPPLSGLSR